MLAPIHLIGSMHMAKVLVPLATGCEELEAVTVIDLLRRASIEVVSAGLGARGEAVRASRGTVLIPDSSLDEALAQEYDMVVLPGGLPGADHLNRDARIHLLLRDMREHGKYTAAICAAPRVLADTGGKRSTSEYRRLWKTYHVRNGAVEKVTLFTESPAETRGGNFMRWAYTTSSGKATDQCVYLPETHMVRRVSQRDPNNMDWGHTDEDLRTM